MSKDKRDERRVSAARRRAETHSTGFTTTVLRLPEGVKFFDPKPGVITIDILPYKAGKGNPNADPGMEYYERTFWQWAKIGIEEKQYCCLDKTFGKRDPITTWKSIQARNPNADINYVNSLKQKERQLFLVSEANNPGIQIWDNSFFLFGKLLDTRIKNSDEDLGWDFFYEAGVDDGGRPAGMSLRLTFEESSGGGYKWLEVVAIDFLPRKKPLDDKLVNHGICLDELLVEKTYEELEKIFLGAAEPEDADADASDDPAPRKKTKPAPEPDVDDEPDPPKKKKKPDPEPDADDDEPTPPPKKKSPPPEDDEPDPPKKKAPVAADFGFSRGDEVLHKKMLCTILKISGDGTSLTLSDPEDNVIHAVAPEDCKALGGGAANSPPKETVEKPAPKEKEKKKEKTPPPEPDDSGDDDWDFE